MKNICAKSRPRQALLIGVWLVTSASCSSKPALEQGAQDKMSAADAIAQAEISYRQRGDLDRAREGLIQLRRAMAEDSSSYEAAWKFARLAYYIGDHTDNTGERDKAFAVGVEAGRRAVKLQDGKPEGHFWLGANLGGQAKASMLSGLTTVDEIKREMERVIQLDPQFQSGSAYMALGQIDLESPRMMGGNPKRAVEILEKNRSTGEQNALYQLRLAQAYIAVGRKDDARKLLEAILTSTPNPDFIPEHNDAVRQAKELLQKGL